MQRGGCVQQHRISVWVVRAVHLHVCACVILCMCVWLHKDLSHSQTEPCGAGAGPF